MLTFLAAMGWACTGAIADSSLQTHGDAAPAGERPDGSASSAVCGNGIVEGDEMCDETSEQCVDCALSCPTSTGLYCGGNGGVGGDTSTLYRCVDNRLQVEEACELGCQAMPSGTPDRCASPLGDVPTLVIDTLDAHPYVEGSCSPTTFPGWPHEAKRCSYTSGGVYAEVTTATPSPERVGRWIMDSSEEIPALYELKTKNPDAYAQGLAMIAKAVMIQSGRIYPLEGDVVENLGSGYYPYNFYKGVTSTCGSGCYCRINSLHRTEWCAWQAHTGTMGYDACIAQVGSSGLTEGWGNQCLANHVAAFNSDRNEHFRARAYRYQNAIKGSCPSAGSCSSGQVLNALSSATK